MRQQVKGTNTLGIVDLLAVRKDHREPRIGGTKRGDALQIILIQVKGGTAAMPTTEDSKRLWAAAKALRARHVLPASWKKGTAARIYSYRPRATDKAKQWIEVSDLDAVFK